MSGGLENASLWCLGRPVVSDTCSGIFCSSHGSPSASCRWGRVTDPEPSPAGHHCLVRAPRCRQAPGLSRSHRHRALPCYFLLDASLPCPVLSCWFWPAHGFDLWFENFWRVVKSHRLWSQTWGHLGFRAVGWCWDWPGNALVHLKELHPWHRISELVFRWAAIQNKWKMLMRSHATFFEQDIKLYSLWLQLCKSRHLHGRMIGNKYSKIQWGIKIFLIVLLCNFLNFLWWTYYFYDRTSNRFLRNTLVIQPPRNR